VAAQRVQRLLLHAALQRARRGAAVGGLGLLALGRLRRLAGARLPARLHHLGACGQRRRQRRPSCRLLLRGRLQRLCTGRAGQAVAVARRRGRPAAPVLQMSIWPSQPALHSLLPSGLAATACTQSLCPLYVATRSGAAPPACSCHSRTT
jgi:hypothetical protein